MSKRDGGPAFPVLSQIDEYGNKIVPGMTMQDYFAAHGPWTIDFILRYSSEKMTRIEASEAAAIANFEYADIMLHRRDNNG